MADQDAVALELFEQLDSTGSGRLSSGDIEDALEGLGLDGMSDEVR